MKPTTTKDITSGNLSPATPEFGRTEDVRRLFGIKRGTLYNLHRCGKVRGVMLRQRGKQTGVRLWDIASIRQYILSEMEVTNAS